MSDKPQETADAGIQAITTEIGVTLRRVISESAQVSSCLARARSSGYEVSLALEATIAVSKRRSPESAADTDFALREEPAEPAVLKMTPLDRKFLRSLKIAVEEDE